MKRIVKRTLGTLCLVGGLGVAMAAAAQTTTAPTWVFTAIDAVRHPSESSLYITGVQEGAQGPGEVYLESYCPSAGICFEESLNACERYAILMMTRPGQFKLEVWKRLGSTSPPAYCRLTKLNP